ncbi:MAG: hypothetical protein H6R21_3307, partial [Proteobacteria bacterium]|nr:hypothetical protein [Pseudomonadota bacterium]
MDFTNNPAWSRKRQLQLKRLPFFQRLRHFTVAAEIPQMAILGIAVPGDHLANPSCSVRLAAKLLGELAEFFLATLVGLGSLLLGSRRRLLGLALLGLFLETFTQLFSGMRTCILGDFAGNCSVEVEANG